MMYIQRIEYRLGSITAGDDYLYVVLPAPTNHSMEPIATKKAAKMDAYQWLPYAWGQALLSAGMPVVAMPEVKFAVAGRGFDWVQFTFRPGHQFARDCGHLLQKHKTALLHFANQLVAVPKMKN